MADPKITAPALVKYCLAQAPERSRIIQEFRDSDYPPFKGWYGETEGAIRRHIASGGIGDASLSDLEKVLEKRPASTDFEEMRILKQLEALEATRHIGLETLRTEGEISVLQDTAAPLLIQGVRVSVRPTNLVTAYRPGHKEPFVGVVKPYISSTDPLSPETAGLFGTLLHWYAEVQLSHIGLADQALCFVIDVFAEKVYRASSAFKKRRDILSFSCEEIADRWKTVPSKTLRTARI